MSSLPVLWHIPVSHYSEKVRWALDYKGVPHDRKAPVGGAHMLIALARTRGKQYTFPVMKLDGRSIGDSTAILEALEARYPEPPLYPADPADRRRALELEDWFDENLGPAMRLLAWHEVTRDSEGLEQVAANTVPPAFSRARGLAAKGVKTFVQLRFRVGDEQAAGRAREQIVVAMEKLESELGDSGYLVGDSFSVADLTAASLFYPLVLPPEGPDIIDAAPAPFERFREPLKERRGYRWVEEMFARHRQKGGARSVAA